MADDPRVLLVRDIFAASIETLNVARTATEASIVATADLIGDVLSRGGKVLVFGNGGSAADSQHLSAELVGRFTRERRALAAIALSTDTSILTSIGNDYSYDRVFVRQLEALGRAGDVAIGITTSGNSPNVIKALEAARASGLKTVALTGRDGGAAGRRADIHLNVPVTSVARAQEAHRTILHAVCELLEQRVMSDGQTGQRGRQNEEDGRQKAERPTDNG